MEQDLSKLISQRRKEIHMTQEQLAETMHVARQTVSHWENGRRQPDEETLAALYEVLGIEPQAADLAVEENTPPAPEPTPEPEVQPRSKRWIILAAAAAVLVAAVFAVRVFWPKQEVVGQLGSSNDQSLTQADLLKPVVARDGVAHLAIEPRSAPVKLMPQPVSNMEDYAWNVEYTVRMQNELPFLLTQMTEIYFMSDTQSQVIRTLSGVECLENNLFPHLVFQPGESFEYNVLLPSDDTNGIVAYGVILEGIDTYGNTLRFTQLIPLSQERVSAETEEEFRAVTPKHATKGYLQLSPAQETIHAVYDEAYQSHMWHYTIDVTNTTFQTMTVLNWKEAYFRDGVVVAENNYDGEHLSEWFGTNVLKHGESWKFKGELAVQDFSGIGAKVTAVDENGYEQMFVCYMALSPNQAP